VPAWRVETRAAYAQIDRNKYGLTGWGAKLRFAQSLGRKSVSPLQALRLGNSFESVLGRREEDFVSLRSRLERIGAGEVHLTGSGSAVFGVVPPRMNVAKALNEFVGTEALYEARSTLGALRLRTS
jgi:4-diphosphocytidyl-2C-methyl-D-erythritol kinase